MEDEKRGRPLAYFNNSLKEKSHLIPIKDAKAAAHLTINRKATDPNSKDVSFSPTKLRVQPRNVLKLRFKATFNRKIYVLLAKIFIRQSGC